jgi:nucleoside-diphosphate-sugar epimerase
MLHALENGSIHHKYIGSDFNNYLSSDLGMAVKQALNKKTIKLKIPSNVITLVAKISESIGKIQGKMPPLNIDKMNELKAESWWCDPKNVKDSLQWKPKFDLYSGMQKTIDWYILNKWL